MILNWIWFWAFGDWTLSLSWQMFLCVLLISHREDTWHVSCPRTCLLTLKWSVFTLRELTGPVFWLLPVHRCREYAMHISFIPLLLVTAPSFDKSETVLSMGPCFSHRLWLLIVREMVMCGPPPSVPDMVPSTSQGLFHCCGLHLAPYVIPNSKCKWALCYSRKIDH